MEEISFYDGLAWPGKYRTVNGREIFDTDQEIGWRAALYPISSAIKLGAFQIVCPGLLSFYHSAFKIEFLLYIPKRKKIKSDKLQSIGLIDNSYFFNVRII